MISGKISKSDYWTILKQAPTDIKKFTGRGSFRPISQIKIDNSFTSDPLLISEILANLFSSNSNYDDSFLTHKL